LAGKTPQHHSGVFVQCASEAGAGKELYWVLVVVGGIASRDLFESDRELIRVERAPLADFSARLH
jgi:hypothetical protein